MANMAPVCALLFVTACAFFMQAEGAQNPSQAPQISGNQPGGHVSGIWPTPWYPHKRCRKPKEVYKDGVSSSCAEKSCLNPFPRGGCTRDRVSGCFCRNRYYRDQWGNCVRRYQCFGRPWPRPTPFPDSWWWGGLGQNQLPQFGITPYGA
uniref:Putative tick til 10 n=1 Tax=Amblyomma cajennense TaxID=34607 RepID=A0A023FQ68_AMBCJ